MTIYLVDIEAVETRYTSEWKQHLPQQLRSHTNSRVVVVSGGEVPQATTPGAFLNFAGTNNYKSQQMLEISRMFAAGEIKDGDYFLYTDAWNPTVIQLRYMAELLGIKISIGGLWHAGSYDPADFLGRLIGDKPWVRSAEHSMFSCYDHNFYATDFHIDMFAEEFFNYSGSTLKQINSTVRRVGWPMEYERDQLAAYRNMEKRDLILFPHRVAPEKQPDIFRDLAEALPEYEFVICMEQQLSKREYHNMLGEAKLIFSANLQETLGISWYEGALVDTIPMVPDRLSYSEMAVDEFLYPSEWTQSWDKYLQHKDSVIERVREYITNYSTYKPALHRQVNKLQNDFFSGAEIYRAISQ